MDDINSELSSIKKSFTNFLSIINGINKLQPHQLKCDTVRHTTASDEVATYAHMNGDHPTSDPLAYDSIIQEPRFGRINLTNEINDGKTDKRVYNESEMEVNHVPYTIVCTGTNNELDYIDIEHLDPILIASGVEVEMVNHAPHTRGGSDNVIKPIVPTPIQPVDSSPINPLSGQPYRLSIEIDARHGCDKNEMFVQTSDQGPKKYCCVYCKKLVSKLVPHLENVHKNEKDVKAFKSFPHGSAERKIIIQGINNLGQTTWNKDASLNKGIYIAARRPNPKRPRKAKEHETCANCYRSIFGKNLRQHWNKCTNNSMKGERIVKALGRAVEKRLHSDACDDLSENIFPNMHDDDCVSVIRYDWLLITFGNDLCLNYSAMYQQDLIKRHLRLAGKVLLASRSIDEEITDFASILHVTKCNTVVDAIREVSGFNRTTKTFEHPSTAAAAVTLINHIAEVLLIESMKEENQERELNVTRFSTVFQKEAKLKLNKIVGVMKEKAHRERDENIPTTTDVRRLADYLDSEIETCFSELKRSYSFSKWRYLAQLTMASIIVFNRKRVGEVRNILVRDFKRREVIAEKYAEQLDGETSDDAFENVKRLIRCRMKIRGKLDRGVPVLLKHTIDDCLQLLCTYRRKAEIPIKNDFLFALPSGPTRLRIIDGWALMRRFSVLCGADNPSSLRGTNLRKHFASSCSTKDLSDNDVTNVANYMGHDDPVHRRIYRHNPLQKEVVQITGLLEAAQGKSNCSYHTNPGQPKQTSLPKRTTAGTSKRTTAATSKRTTAGTSKRTTAGTSKRTTAGTSKRTTASTSKRTTAGRSKRTTASTSRRTTAGTLKQTTPAKRINTNLKHGQTKRARTGPINCSTTGANDKKHKIPTGPTGRTIKRPAKFVRFATK